MDKTAGRKEDGGGIRLKMLKNTHIWLSSYIRHRMRPVRTFHRKRPIHIIFCLVDHFEPGWSNPSYSTEVKRVGRWIEDYPKIASQFCDADRRFPQHTFFYPEEEYRHEHLEKLSALCKNGFAEVEIHLHHSYDTARGFREKIERCKNNFVKHGLLSRDKTTKEVKFGFIHGNWALNNSRRDDRWCGVDNELGLLREAGCYADFTLPSAPDISQTSKINSIYYAEDRPGQKKSHDTGIDVEVGKLPSGDLMLIQGPLGLNWKKRKAFIIPRIENGEISSKNPPTKNRVDLWIDEHIHVKGKSDWVFVKVYTHGAQEANADILLGDRINEMHSYLGNEYNDGKDYVLHYVTAREMFNIIKAAEAGLDGDPSKYRDHVLNRISL